MKYFLTCLCFLKAAVLFAQSGFPAFLEGTWKIEGRENYEHWDLLNADNLKGFSYEQKDGKIVVSEYLDISRNGEEIIYTAAVLHQNEGNAVKFKLNRADTRYSFEHPGHDFPKRVVYQKRSESQIDVVVGEGSPKAFSYRMHKLSEKPAGASGPVSNPNYDAGLAGKLNADEYGMKSYILVMLKTGSNQTEDRPFIDSCFRGHMNNIDGLVKQGKLIVAGPLGENDRKYRGIFILDAASLEEAETLLRGDPAIKANLLKADLYQWYGSAALPEYLQAADRIWKIKP